MKVIVSFCPYVDNFWQTSLKANLKTLLQITIAKAPISDCNGDRNACHLLDNIQGGKGGWSPLIYYSQSVKKKNLKLFFFF